MKKRSLPLLMALIVLLSMTCASCRTGQDVQIDEETTTVAPTIDVTQVPVETTEQIIPTVPGEQEEITGDIQPLATKPDETEPAGTESPEDVPAETQPIETESDETQSSETESDGTEPTETQPYVEDMTPIA